MTGAEIKALLADLGITTRQLAAKLDVPPPVVLAWQKEELFPTKRHVEAMRALEARAAQEKQALLTEGTAVSEERQLPEGSGVAAPVPVPAGLSDPAFWTLVRKLLAYPALRNEVEEAAAKYRDPAEGTEESR